jgi:hypothetical protein
VYEQPVLPAREVLERELVVVRDQLRVVVARERFEADAVRRADDFDAIFGDDRTARHVEIERRGGRGVRHKNGV